MRKINCCAKPPDDPLEILDKIDETMESLLVKMKATRYKMSELAKENNREAFKQKEAQFVGYLGMYMKLDRVSDEIQRLLDNVDVAQGLGLGERLLSTQLADFDIGKLDQMMDSLEDQMVESAEIAQALAPDWENEEEELILPTVPQRGTQRTKQRVLLPEL
jgi:hypothetical protein